jgi:hypothetical protein
MSRRQFSGTGMTRVLGPIRNHHGRARNWRHFVRDNLRFFVGVSFTTLLAVAVFSSRSGAG